MEELQTFSNPLIGNIRVVTINGNPYFVGRDVADILGYKNASAALQRHVDNEDKGIRKVTTLGGIQEMTVINESGLYSMVFSSKLPEAKRFKKWIRDEVLTDIRKHGAYATPVTIDKIIEDPEFGIQLLQNLAAEREKRKALEVTVAIKDQQLLEMQPKVSYYDIVLACDDLIKITTIAKDYGWSGERMNKELHDRGIQYKTIDGQWLLYQKHADKGYTATKTHAYTDSSGTTRSRIHTYWTQKGRLFIYDLLKKDGILPTIESEALDG